LLELETAFIALERDETIGVVIVTGAGNRAFVAGGDVSDLNSHQDNCQLQRVAEVIHRVMH
jgi:enoyl-CoA hydratase